MMGALKELTSGNLIALPTADIWFDDSQASDYFSCSVGHFQSRVICLASFPKPRIFIGSRRWNLIQ
jgi:hypothetical protein